MSGIPNMVAYGATHLGRQRARNEDAFFVGKLQRSVFAQDTNLTGHQGSWMNGATEGWVLMVADGMGGQGSGDLASRAAVIAVLEYLCNAMPWTVGNALDPGVLLLGVREQLARAVSVGESIVRQEATRPGASAGMGTTLTMAYVLWPHLHVAHVGDSRCYLLREGQLVRLTTDHTMAERLAREGNGELDPSSPWHHVLWNALGADEAEAQPEILHLELQEHDQVLLCSDGLTHHVDDGLLREYLVADMPVEDSADRLIAAANEAGGFDNITVIVARFQPATQAVRPLRTTHRAA